MFNKVISNYNIPIRYRYCDDMSADTPKQNGCVVDRHKPLIMYLKRKQGFEAGCNSQRSQLLTILKISCKSKHDPNKTIYLLD